MTHTPGPWGAYEPVGSSRRVFMPNDLVEIRNSDKGGGLIAALYKENWAQGRDEANARLIAAAPALLEALEWIAEIADKNIDDEKLRAGGARTLNRIIERADAAIAQAKGDKE